MVTTGRNIVISCFEARALVFFCTCIPQKFTKQEFRDSISDPQTHKMSPEIPQGPPERPPSDPQTPKGCPNYKINQKIHILLPFGTPKTLQNEPPDRQNSQQIDAPKKFFLALNFHLIFGRFSPPNRLQKSPNFQPLPTTWIL